MKLSTLLLGALLSSAALISTSGCSAMNTALGKSDLEVHTKMSETIFLEPVAENKQTVYIKVRNTSEKDMELKKYLSAEFAKNGFKIVKDPKKATFMLQANILKVDNMDEDASKKYLKSGFAGAAVGGVVGGVATESSGGAAAGAGIGAMLGMATEYFISDEYFTMVTDIQIRERPLAGEHVTQSHIANNKQGSSGSTTQVTRGAKVNWKTYRARVVSTANQVNLTFAEAKGPLQKDLAHSIKGVF